MRQNVPNVDAAMFIVDFHHKSVIVIANIENNKLATDGVGSLVCLSNIVRSCPVCILSGFVPMTQGLLCVRVFFPELPEFSYGEYVQAVAP